MYQLSVSLHITAASGMQSAATCSHRTTKDKTYHALLCVPLKMLQVS